MSEEIVRPTIEELCSEVGFNCDEDYELDEPMIHVNATYTRESDGTIWSVFYSRSGDGNYNALLDGDVSDSDIVFHGLPEPIKEALHTDVLGQPIYVGSTVLYGSGGGRGNYAGFKPSKVLKITEKMIRISYYGSERVVRPTDCVVIDKLLEEVK